MGTEKKNSKIRKFREIVETGKISSSALFHLHFQVLHRLLKNAIYPTLYSDLLLVKFVLEFLPDQTPFLFLAK